MTVFFVKLLRYLSRFVDILITWLDSDKSKTDFGSYRVELKFYLEDAFGGIQGRVLDAGSGTWTWLKDKFSQKEGCTVLCFDKFSHKNVDICGDLINLDNYFPPRSFDAVVCTDVIEHVENPFAVINNIARILRPGGLIIISCPFDKELHGEEYGDYWRITRQGWLGILKEKFQDIEIKHLGHESKPKAYFIKAKKCLSQE